MKKEELDMELQTEEKAHFLDFINNLWLHKYLIITITLVFMIAAGVKAIFLTEDTYTASGVLYVSSRNGINQGYMVQKSDLDAARILSATYTETLKLRSFLTAVSDSINNKYSWQQIKSMLNVSTVNDTELISISVTSDSPGDSYIIATNIAELAAKKLTEVSNGGYVMIIDQVQEPLAPNSRGIQKKITAGLVLGLTLGIGIVFLMGIFDRKIRNSEDIAKRYNISILGELSK